MSQVYVTATTDTGSVTRRGHHWVRATAQSWDGSVMVELERKADGRVFVSVSAAPGSESHPRAELFDCELADLLWAVEAINGRPAPLLALVRRLGFEDGDAARD